eukprot:1121135-Pleurochrysis_carterae.AAC.1
MAPAQRNPPFTTRRFIHNAAHRCQRRGTLSFHACVDTNTAMGLFRELCEIQPAHFGLNARSWPSGQSASTQCYLASFPLSVLFARRYSDVRSPCRSFVFAAFSVFLLVRPASERQ